MLDSALSFCIESISMPNILFFFFEAINKKKKTFLLLSSNGSLIKTVWKYVLH